jgi:hypothetical protein
VYWGGGVSQQLQSVSNEDMQQFKHIGILRVVVLFGRLSQRCRRLSHKRSHAYVRELDRSAQPSTWKVWGVDVSVRAAGKMNVILSVLRVFIE